MAQRRMFSLQIVDTDAFLEMPLSSQALYFHLSMRADDDGFVSNPKKIMRMLGSQDDELRVLIAKRFIIPFESGICVIKHWKIHNYIQNDRYNETKYLEEKDKLLLKDNGSYTEKNKECIQDVSSMDTQVRLGKVRKGKSKDNNTLANSSEFADKVNPLIEMFKEINPNYTTLFANTTQRNALIWLRSEERRV